MIQNFNSKHFKLEKISNGIYAAIAKEGGGSVANAGIIDLGNKTIIFDTFNTQQAAEDLKQIAEKITKQPITWIINSHWHGDHIRGNQVFKGSTIISSNITYEKMKNIHPARIHKQKNDIEGLRNYIHSLKNQMAETYDIELDYQIKFLNELEISLPELELILPHQTFKDEVAFHGTKRSAKLFTLGGGHSFCDAMLYIPEEKVIFMGDLLFIDCHPTFFDESNPNKWIDILTQIKIMDIDIAVPGHGSIGTSINLFQIIDYIQHLTLMAQENPVLENIRIPNNFQHWSSPEVYLQNIKQLRKSLS